LDTGSQNNDDSDSLSDNDAQGDEDGGKETILLCIPNYEIQSIINRWLRIHMTKRISAENQVRSSRHLFKLVTQGSINQFAREFGFLILETLPIRFLGNNGVVYQAFVYAFLTAAAQAISVTPRWEVDMEHYSGFGCLDLIIQRPSGIYGAIQEYKRIKILKKDKMDGYGDSQCQRLTKVANEALKQVETRLYRARMPPNVTKLRECGVAFLGPFCAVVGCLLERNPGDNWVVKEKYTSQMDEQRRSECYHVGVWPANP
jgi:hypothetical protein